MDVINCKGLACPMPVINTKKYFDLENSKEVLVVVDNKVARDNILRFAKATNLFTNVVEEQGLFNITLSKTEEKSLDEAKKVMDFTKEVREDKLTILISSNLLGGGDDELGTMLMKVYINTLAEADKLPKNLMFINGGVKLTCTGSDVIESLQTLKDKGVNIISCGACLDFYNLKDELKVGEIGNMYYIIDEMNSSTNTIKL